MRMLSTPLQPLRATLFHPKHSTWTPPCSRTQTPQWTRFFHASSSCRALALAYDLHNNGGKATGAPILILHGLFGNKKNHRSISKALSRDLHRPIYAVDLRNHGESAHDKTHNYTVLAEDTEAFIEQHGLKHVTLIGHSMGAKTVMTMALRNPGRYASMIAVDNAPVDAALTSDFPKYVEGMRRVEEGRVMSHKEADEILEPYAKELAVRQFIMTNLVRPSPSEPLRFRIPVRTLTYALDDMADFPFTNPDEHTFTKPSLFIRGTRSHYITDETLPIIGRFFPRFQLTDIEAGHWVISENPVDFRKAVVEFLEEQEE
ncbi:alpha/beta-hydrolase [Amniculicola lignicola CBS 123094]|uniref:Alpha/beta-hydrolase n=1 Tax=Amniculicola lignicola CBS 123094 TaxID=1392246 RepID=A0A6A5VUR7_9PLEO|nr:alpha/beta-hydrolase [Amniculicola lignicola CBS 123094]